MEDQEFMHRAIELAQLAEQEGNLPVGTVIVLDGKSVAEGRNCIWCPEIELSRHAEMQALRAVPLELWARAREMTLYTTLEPCLMCLGSILLHRVGRVVFGSEDPFGGAGSVIPSLPPYFQEQFESTQWQGPMMREACDPLFARLLAIQDMEQS